MLDPIVMEHAQEVCEAAHHMVRGMSVIAQRAMSDYRNLQKANADLLSANQSLILDNRRLQAHIEALDDTIADLLTPRSR